MSAAETTVTAPVARPTATAGDGSHEPAIRIRNLRKAYGPIEAVRGIDLDVQAGEIFGLIGPDGAGKTSVFQILGGVIQLKKNEAQMLGHSARDSRSYVCYL